MKKYNSTNIESSYKYCPLAENVKKALTTPLRRFSLFLKNYVLIIDEETKDVILLFPLNDINRADKNLKEIVITDLTNNFKASGLILKEQKGIIKDTYKVGFIPIIFTVKSI